MRKEKEKKSGREPTQFSEVSLDLDRTGGQPGLE
jgi:hypothetical protein